MQSSDKGQYAESWTQADFSLLTGSEALAKSKLRGASAGPGVNTGSMSGGLAHCRHYFFAGIMPTCCGSPSEGPMAPTACTEVALPCTADTIGHWKLESGRHLP